MSRLGNGGRIGGVLAFVLMAVAQLPGSTTAAQDNPTALVELNGVGAGEVTGLLNAWATTMYDAPAGVSLSYVPKGDKNGRLTFSRGEADFVVTGRPFAEEEKANLAARDVDVIEAPIAVSALTVLMSGPGRNPLITIVGDPNDEDAPVVRTPYTGEVRVPNDVLARGFLDIGSPFWQNESLIANFAPLVLARPNQSPEVIVRSDPGAMNYYLESYINNVGKTDYDTKLANYQLPPGLLSEAWPLLVSPSRTGDDALGTLVGAGQGGAGQGYPQGGVIAPLSPTAANRQIALQGEKPVNERVPLYQLPILNGANEWVRPTPESISTAAAAGNGTPLYGLTENAPGAYPLTWISSIAAPSKGLTPEKATALATAIRFMVTEGQSATAPLGEGRLPTPMVQKAIEAADQIVTSNCTGSDRTLATVDGGGPNWPNGVPAPATSKICKAVTTPGVTTTTVFVGPVDTQAGLVTPPTTQPAPAYVPPAVTPTPKSSGVGALPDSSYDGDLGPTDVAVESISETADTSPPTTAGDGDAEQLNVSSVAAQLPLALPSDGRFGLDRLATAALGGAAFMLVRGSIRKRLSAATS